jgi:REP element-mobilizing transposase RayT
MDESQSVVHTRRGCKPHIVWSAKDRQQMFYGRLRQHLWVCECYVSQPP